MEKRMLIGLIMVALLHSGAILRADDPIGDTQADSVEYAQVVEREEKGNPELSMPKVEYYGGGGFFGSIARWPGV